MKNIATATALINAYSLFIFFLIFFSVILSSVMMWRVTIYKDFICEILKYEIFIMLFETIVTIALHKWQSRQDPISIFLFSLKDPFSLENI